MTRHPLRSLVRLAGTLLTLVVVAASPTAGASREATPGVPQRELPAKANGRPPSHSGPAYRHGVVAVSHPLAAEAGAAVLQRGGNAIDAAAAIQLTLNVVEPQFSGIGGGGFMMIHRPTDETFVIDSRERAPGAATAELFRKPGCVGPDPSCYYPFAAASRSGISVGVPGTLLGVATALQRYGTISLADALQPAIALAENGFAVNDDLAFFSNNDRVSSYPETTAIFRRPDGAPLQPGDWLVQPDLARTFRLIATQGTDVFYRGEIADAIVAAQGRSVTGGAGGIMTTDDLARYTLSFRQPVVGDYRGYTVKSMPPPSSGGLTLLQMLDMLERFPIGDSSQGFGFGTTRTAHVMVEAMRLAYADRAKWMGDEDFVPVPKEGLLAPPYVDQRAATISLTSRMATPGPGDPWAYEETSGASAAAELEESLHTTHFSVVDKWGNVVSYTTTIEDIWGTGITVPGYGFLLNNELTDFNMQPRADAAIGDPGANDVAGGKRPRSSMTPTMLFRGDEPFAAYGSPGGARIINTVLGITLNLIDHQMSIQQAIDAPRISVTNPAGRVDLEPHFPQAAADGLAALGHPLNPRLVIGSVQAVVIDLQTGKQYGGADSRREGTVIGLPRRGPAR